MDNLYQGFFLTMFHKTRALIFCILAIFISHNCLAKNAEQSGKLWASIETNGEINKSQIEYMSELHGRFGYDAPNFNEGIFRIGLGYPTSQTISVWFGYDFIPMKDLITKEFSIENRIWQQILWEVPLEGFWQFTYRARLEERIDAEASGTAIRLRQKLIVKMNHLEIGTDSFIPIIYDEIFFNLNHPDWIADKTVDENRLFVGFGYQIDTRHILEVGYINQLALRNPDNIMNHILSLSYRIF